MKLFRYDLGRRAFLVKLVLCAAVCTLALLLKALFPNAALAVSQAFFGGGSYKAAMADIGYGDSVVDAFAQFSGQ